jgi:hypothetical protein
MITKSLVDKVSKKRFLDVYNKYPANGWIRFAFKYFSNESEKNDLKLKNGYALLLIGLFCIGFFGTIFNAPRKFILLSTVIYSILLVVLVAYLSSAVILNNIRIKKIYSELNISRNEYNNLAELYFNK